MSTLHISELYREIYKRFDALTPVPFDCGRLCDKACCRGDGETGMYLFPGEERLFVDKPGFSVLPTELSCSYGAVQLLVCHKPCERTERPLACRIFPLIPFYRKGSTLQIIRDPRARFCPLTYPETVGYIEGRFIREVRHTFQLLCKIPEVAEFLDTLSYVLDDFRKLM